MKEGVPVPDRAERVVIADEQWNDARLLWNYHQMGHRPRPCSAAIGLGSHDLGVATTAADLYRAGLFPVIVFSGGNSPTTAARFPRGEAVHYREHALKLGVPGEAILVEPKASNTGQNIAFSREVLRETAVESDSLLLISKPYMERRAYATCRKVWPEINVVCASEPLELDDYVKAIGDEKLVIDMLVGDLQRVIEYPKLGYSIEQEVPEHIHAAYQRLLHAGFDSRLLKP
ncbi:YdcF family protein [Streptomyces sp. A73]|uniref:YdcF family protein n=1 Tax=Streptomyces sp. RK75 TaxID=2824895 RepID=UPI001B37BF26|nr:YdcF family protein [Streptomyces sp. RK75]MBQ0867608.1 YdcF family protein [Streptomyces sp. RK75]MBQ1157426.1 YdcF family protein [Streptomyces sp. A73]